MSTADEFAGEFAAIIGSKNDLILVAEQSDIKLTPEELNDAYEEYKKRLGDWLSDDGELHACAEFVVKKIKGDKK